MASQINKMFQDFPKILTIQWPLFKLGINGKPILIKQSQEIYLDKYLSIFYVINKNI